MQSLRQFLALKKRPYGIRTSLENFCEYADIQVYPLYAIKNALAPDAQVGIPAGPGFTALDFTPARC